MYENCYDIVKKAMRLGLMIKTRTLLVDHTLAHFFVVFLQPQHEIPEFYGQKFSLFSLKLDAVSDNSIKVKFSYIWQLSRQLSRDIAIKFER